MATGGASGSLEVDAVPVPEVPSQATSGGYRKEIFHKKEEQDRFSCGFCGKILREPVQADCGHRFCRSCQTVIEELTQKGKQVLCKQCQEEGTSNEESRVDPKEMFPDRGFKREMVNIRTKCPNDPCVWNGLFKDYVNHEDECQHQPLACSQCGDLVSKHKVDQHKARECSQRTITCEHCNTPLVFAQKKQHLKDCTKVPEVCSQCSKHVPRDKMRRHKGQDCPNRMVTCPIEGCSSPQQQNRFQQHVQKDQTKHLAWVLSRMDDLDEAIRTLALTSSRTSASSHTQQTAGTEPVSALKTKLEQLEQRLQEMARQGTPSAVGGATGGGGDGDPGQANGGAEASVSSGNNSAERITAMEFKVNSLEPILSVLHGEMNRCIGAIEAVEARLQQELTAAQQYRTKLTQQESTVQALNTTATQQETKIRELESRLMAVGQDSADGTLLWRIPNFSQVRKDAMAATVTNIHSRPFYTGPLGYKMCVRLYPNGDGMGKGTHLSLFFSIMRSNNDALLPWPFKQKVYFMLIDQNCKKHIVDAFRSEPTSSSFQRPTSEMNIATGCPMFVQLNKLHQHGYLKDDTLFIRVVVETEGLADHFKQFDPRNLPLQ